MSFRSVFRSDLFQGQTVVVTGGGSGIGRCTAHELVALGARVAIVGRDADKLQQVSQELQAERGVVSTHVCDIRDEEAVAATVDAVLAAHGRIDGLVNNAGGQYWSALRDMRTQGFDAVLRNNLTGGFLFMREAYLRWMERHGGAIVNITAALSNGLPGFAHSGAARAGMHNLTETAACEWAAAGVRVNSVAPGMIASSGLDRYDTQAAERIRRYAGTIPLQRFGNVAEVSSAIVYLLSPAAAFMTGACIRMDGGGSRPPGVWQLAAHDKSVPFDGFHLSSTPELLNRG